MTDEKLGYCDNVDCKNKQTSNADKQMLYYTMMKKEFEGGWVYWCKDCIGRDNDFIRKTMYRENQLPLVNVKEHGDGYNPYIVWSKHNISIKAVNEGGYNSTSIDLIDLLKFFLEHNIITLTKDYVKNLNKLKELI